MPPFEIADDDVGMTRYSAGGREPRLIRRVDIRVFQRIAWRDEPPDRAKIQAIEGGQRKLAVSVMRRVERTAEKADAAQFWRVV